MLYSPSCVFVASMPVKIDTQHELACQKDASYMPQSRAIGDDWLTDKILEIASIRGIFVSKGGSEAMAKATTKWDGVAQGVQSACQARQRTLCEEYHTSHAAWRLSEDERAKKSTGKGRAARRPTLTVVKHEVSADYCQRTFTAVKTQYTDLAIKHKLSRCAVSDTRCMWLSAD